MVVGKWVGKYPKFKAIDPYNTQMGNKNCENFFEISKYEHGVAHCRPYSNTFCLSISHFLMNHPTAVLNLSNSNHVGALTLHRAQLSLTLMWCLSQNNNSL